MRMDVWRWVWAQYVLAGLCRKGNLRNSVFQGVLGRYFSLFFFNFFFCCIYALSHLELTTGAPAPSPFPRLPFVRSGDIVKMKWAVAFRSTVSREVWVESGPSKLGLVLYDALTPLFLTLWLYQDTVNSECSILKLLDVFQQTLIKPVVSIRIWCKQWSYQRKT